MTRLVSFLAYSALIAGGAAIGASASKRKPALGAAVGAMSASVGMATIATFYMGGFESNKPVPPPSNGNYAPLLQARFP